MYLKKADNENINQW